MNKGSLKRFGALFVLGSIGVLVWGVTQDWTEFGDTAVGAGVSTGEMAVLTLVSVHIALAATVAVGLYCAPRLGFQSVVLNRVSQGEPLLASLKPHAIPALGIGVVFGAFLIGVEFVTPLLLEGVGAEREQTVSFFLNRLPGAVIMGGITEELLFRWGFMTLIIFALWKAIGRGRDQPQSWLVWTGIVAAALIFGVSHLPAVFALYGTSVHIVLFTLLGNGAPAIVFGWIFWRYSIEAAMITHGFAHFVNISAIVVLVSTGVWPW
jgi:membrane protease YdiL (CAAX protease family)